MDQTYFYVVRVERANKTPTFKLFKHMTPALKYKQRAEAERGTVAVFGSFDWAWRGNR